jgi:hypothetical protein
VLFITIVTSLGDQYKFDQQLVFATRKSFHEGLREIREHFDEINSYCSPTYRTNTRFVCVTEEQKVPPEDLPMLRSFGIIILPFAELVA